jgi:hypothetical protein
MGHILLYGNSMLHFASTNYIVYKWTNPQLLVLLFTAELLESCILYTQPRI